VADSLMSVAATGLFAAKWTTKIEEEWIGSLERERPDLKGKLSYRRDQMRIAVPDWEIRSSAWEPLMSAVELPDADDRHVLAAAIAGHADCVVTSNLKHFPNDVLGKYSLHALHPDDFLVNQWDLDEIEVIAAFKGMRARWRKPEATPDDFVRVMERNGLVATANRLREAMELI
jgi:predicted nucleic acid-binding protein